MSPDDVAATIPFPIPQNHMATDVAPIWKRDDNLKKPPKAEIQQPRQKTVFELYWALFIIVVLTVGMAVVESIVYMAASSSFPTAITLPNGTIAGYNDDADWERNYIAQMVIFCVFTMLPSIFLVVYPFYVAQPRSAFFLLKTITDSRWDVYVVEICRLPRSPDTRVKFYVTIAASILICWIGIIMLNTAQYQVEQTGLSNSMLAVENVGKILFYISNFLLFPYLVRSNLREEAKVASRRGSKIYGAGGQVDIPTPDLTRLHRESERRKIMLEVLVILVAFWFPVSSMIPYNAVVLQGMLIVMILPAGYILWRERREKAPPPSFVCECLMLYSWS
jgi:hypothetical protein